MLNFSLEAFNYVINDNVSKMLLNIILLLINIWINIDANINVKVLNVHVNFYHLQQR